MNYLADLEEAYALGCQDERIIAILERAILGAGVYEDKTAMIEAQNLLFEAATCQKLRAKQLAAFQFLLMEYESGNVEVDHHELMEQKAQLDGPE